MRVKIRHVNDAESRDAGDMNPDQLRGFLMELNARGVFRNTDIDDGHYADATVQYVDEAEEFFAEVIYGTPE